MATFALTYAVQSGTSQSLVLWIVTLANFVNIFTLMFYARLSDTFGRRRIMLIGYLLTAVSIWGVFALLSTSVGWMVLVAYLISNPSSQAFMYGPLSAFMAEMFPTRNRYTGMSLSFQLATTIASGFAPLVAAALLTAAGSTVPITALVSALCVAGALSLVLGRRIHTRSVGAASCLASAPRLSIADAQGAARRASSPVWWWPRRWRSARCSPPGPLPRTSLARQR
jgi:MFS family permease